MGRNTEDFTQGQYPSKGDVETAWMSDKITNEEAMDLSPTFMKNTREKLKPESDTKVNQVHRKAGIADMYGGVDVIQEHKGRSYKAEKARTKRRTENAKSKSGDMPGFEGTRAALGGLSIRKNK